MSMYAVKNVDATKVARLEGDKMDGTRSDRDVAPPRRRENKRSDDDAGRVANDDELLGEVGGIRCPDVLKLRTLRLSK
jgi:hypothetical protein